MTPITPVHTLTPLHADTLVQFALCADDANANDNDDVAVDRATAAYNFSKSSTAQQFIRFVQPHRKIRALTPDQQAVQLTD